MEVTKGQAGRKVCGTIEVVVGALIGLGAIVNAIRGFFDIFSFLGAAIIGYIITGIISVLFLGFVTIGSFMVIVNYEDYFQFQRFNDPVGAVGPPPDYNYSNPGYVHTAQTQQNDGNKSVGGGGAPPIYNNSNTASVDTKQGLA
ncbi:hypothetical protein HOLleu_11289 [Holothuria leucospilota]|uniref:Uncharacterized protein n=1 Tax=Holothuria leucospilota TaxID=206669 RepID=A0A9Q1CEP5_HOLLE|nr:hypothetical protein HOLleu_11289 [Holothuria leucospilota]